MINYEKDRLVIVKGLKKYLGVPVIRSNQNAEPPPYDYLSYTITTLMSENRGTYGEYEDGFVRKPVLTIWSITALSDDNNKSVALASKARNWFEYAGRTYLNDNKVIVQSAGGITNRDNVLTNEYEYRNGFDVVFWTYDEIDMSDTMETIDAMEFGEDYNKELESRLDGVVHTESGITQVQEDDEYNALLADRLSGV